MKKYKLILVRSLEIGMEAENSSDAFKQGEESCQRFGYENFEFVEDTGEEIKYTPKIILQ